MDYLVDRRPRQRTQGFYQDVSQNLAKVRVAGSNPVVRSNQKSGSEGFKASSSPSISWI